MDTFRAVMLACAVTATVYALTGCSSVKSALQPPAQYLPSQQFGNGGATPCMDGNCIAVHQHKALPPCN